MHSHAGLMPQISEAGELEPPQARREAASVGVLKLSLRDDSRREIECHKWIASMHAGRDLGETAVRDWIRLHWSGYLRARWIEHLQGKTRWIELDSRDYGLLQKELQEHALLLDRIIDRLKEGQENLDIIQWALDWHLPMNDVISILSTVDINSKRLGYQFDS
jgi:hypothetical protein